MYLKVPSSDFKT